MRPLAQATTVSTTHPNAHTSRLQLRTLCTASISKFASCPSAGTVWFDEDMPVCGCGNVLEDNARFCCCCGATHDPMTWPQLRAKGAKGKGQGKGKGKGKGKGEGEGRRPDSGKGQGGQTISFGERGGAPPQPMPSWRATASIPASASTDTYPGLRLSSAASTWAVISCTTNLGPPPYIRLVCKNKKNKGYRIGHKFFHLCFPVCNFKTGIGA